MAGMGGRTRMLKGRVHVGSISPPSIDASFLSWKQPTKIKR